MLSTYNGERYLRQFLDSALNQKNVNVHLVVRDDGSTDGTIDILDEYATRYPEDFTVMKKQNIGCERSFYELLKTDYKADYYAFADQDDIWMNNKIESAIRELKKYSGPGVYGCNLLICDADMNPIRNLLPFKTEEEFKEGFHNRIFTNIQGCVLVWNAAMQKLLRNYTPDADICHHDSWVNLAGKIIGGGATHSTPIRISTTGSIAVTRPGLQHRSSRRLYAA